VTDLNPVRTFESHGVEDQTSEEWNTKKSCIGRPRNPGIPDETYSHHMISIKTASPAVPYVEQCADCSWIDPASLQWWADNAVKLSLNARAKRIAVAVDIEPFAFVQMQGEPPLELDEIIAQALGAASACWVGGTGELEFNSTRAKAIWEALRVELRREFDAERENAANRLEEWMINSFSSGTIAEARRIVQAATERKAGLKDWSELAHELYALACNSQALDPMRAEEWKGGFLLLKARYHALT
jgi:hypothetical protein